MQLKADSLLSLTHTHVGMEKKPAVTEERRYARQNWEAQNSHLGRKGGAKTTWER